VSGYFARALKLRVRKIKTGNKACIILGACAAAVLIFTVLFDTVVQYDLVVLIGDCFLFLFVGIALYLTSPKNREAYELQKKIKKLPKVKRYYAFYTVFCIAYLVFPIAALGIYAAVTDVDSLYIPHEALGWALLAFLGYAALFIWATVFFTGPYRKAYLEERVKTAEQKSGISVIFPEYEEALNLNATPNGERNEDEKR
jgi:hypothetical protein